MRRGAVITALAALMGCAAATYTPAPAAPPRALFSFHSNPWLSLHHFVRAVARGLPVSTELSAEESATWDAGVAFYRERYAERDLLFDQGMVEIETALRAAETKDSLAGLGLDADLAAELERLAPVYRAHWWPEHDAANRAWIAAVEPLVARHGTKLAERVAKAYDQSWPLTPVPVDLTPTAGPFGAYTTTPTHTTIAAGDPRNQGFASLELLFHEASHAWGRRLQTTVASSSAARHRKVPPLLWHAVLFYNAGELTRRVLAEDGAPGYVEYAVKNGVYPRQCGEGCRERVAAAWNPRLDGELSMDEAVDRLVASWPDE